jgi:hypothetical protein
LEGEEADDYGKLELVAVKWHVGGWVCRRKLDWFSLKPDLKALKKPAINAKEKVENVVKR